MVALQRVVGKMLSAFGEHYAVDLYVCAGPDKRHVLVDLGQAAAQGADGPLQGRILVDQRPLMGKVPDARAPVLEVDVAEFRPRADVDFDGPAVQTGGRGIQAGRLGQPGRFRRRFSQI